MCFYATFGNHAFRRRKRPAIYSVLNVPHGRISYKFYKLNTLNDTRPLVIYTPPGYDPQSDQKYPVHYLRDIQ